MAPPLSCCYGETLVPCSAGFPEAEFLVRFDFWHRLSASTPISESMSKLASTPEGVFKTNLNIGISDNRVGKRVAHAP